VNSWFSFGKRSSGGISSSAAGKNVNVTSRPMAIPRHIMKPKSSTGTIRAAISEPKAAMVVRALYRHGANLLTMVCRVSSAGDRSGSRNCSSR